MLVETFLWTLACLRSHLDKPLTLVCGVLRFHLWVPLQRRGEEGWTCVPSLGIQFWCWYADRPF